jgi:ATP-dependent Lon protease
MKNGVGNKGKKVLKNVDYDVFKRAFIQAIMENIREKGVSGKEVQEIIKETLDDKRFNFFVKKSLKDIAKETNLTPKECNQALPALMEEKVADEMDDNLKGEIHSEEKKNIEKKR